MALWPLQERCIERSRNVCSCNHVDSNRESSIEIRWVLRWSQEQTPATALRFEITAKEFALTPGLRSTQGKSPQGRRGPMQSTRAPAIPSSAILKIIAADHPTLEELAQISDTVQHRRVIIAF